MLVVSLYVYAFLSEFILIYPVYALLFTDTGISVAEVSSLFVIWSVTGMVLEIPSGAWADTVSRRLLLFLGPLLSGLGFALWVLSPSYWVFAAGFVLWGPGRRWSPARTRRSRTRSWTGAADPAGTRPSWAARPPSAWPAARRRSAWPRPCSRPAAIPPWRPPACWPASCARPRR
ncbi:MFS transporter [Nonomuraea thailandensis]